MHSKQYTLRNVPKPVDTYLRKQARLSGKSLNQVIIDQLSENAGLNDVSIKESLDWFIGSGIGGDVVAVLAEEDKIQKSLTQKQWKKDAPH